MTSIPDAIMVGASGILLIGYHIVLVVQTTRTPEKTAFGQHRIARKLWLRQYARSSAGVLVVQTLRNWMMSATFLASTSILVALGILGIITASDKIAGLTQELHLWGLAGQQVLLFKFMIILFLFMIAYFAFSLSIRFINHAGFVVNIPKGPENDLLFLDQYQDIERGSLFYFFGLPCLYLAVPMVMWLLGPAWLLAATILLTCVLFTFD